MDQIKCVLKQNNDDVGSSVILYDKKMQTMLMILTMNSLLKKIKTKKMVVLKFQEHDPSPAPIYKSLQIGNISSRNHDRNYLLNVPEMTGSPVKLAPSTIKLALRTEESKPTLNELFKITHMSAPQFVNF